GHGNIDAWRGNLLNSEIAAILENRDRPTLFVMMSCLNGYMHDPAVDSLAESLMKAQGGGAVAVWASAGISTPDEQALMNLKLFQALFSGPVGRTLGEAARNAKAAVTNPDVRRTWIFLGDPTTRFK
ncbi:MAG TPA: C25 family cysteine peptidase, partial [Blastocatellia bacterium]|nr:C25 family cysteine peptidase [Blastocatellia bacterium]